MVTPVLRAQHSHLFPTTCLLLTTRCGVCVASRPSKPRYGGRVQLWRCSGGEQVCSYVPLKPRRLEADCTFQQPDQPLFFFFFVLSVRGGRAGQPVVVCFEVSCVGVCLVI